MVAAEEKRVKKSLSLRRINRYFYGVNPSFHTLVIGKGLLGSAAAKYLAENQPDIALIGPDEPTDYAQAHVFPATTMPPACRRY